MFGCLCFSDPQRLENAENVFRCDITDRLAANDRACVLFRKRSINRVIASADELVYRRDQVKLNRPKSDAKARVVRNHPPFLSKARL